MKVKQATGTKVSSQSIPYSWVKPRATSRVLYQSIATKEGFDFINPFTFSKEQLTPIYVLSFSKAYNSSDKACCQNGLELASLYKEGSCCKNMVE